MSRGEAWPELLLMTKLICFRPSCKRNDFYPYVKTKALYLVIPAYLSKTLRIEHGGLGLGLKRDALFKEL